MDIEKAIKVIEKAIEKKSAELMADKPVKYPLTPENQMSLKENHLHHLRTINSYIKDGGKSVPLNIT